MDLFLYGATWLRVDFHLHTKADNKFEYLGEENDFCSAYVEALKRAGIHVGIITNHDKFDLGEFKALRKKAKNKDIFLLPGVELSIDDGANGIHTLVVFSDEWLKDGNYINPFLSVAFGGRPSTQYENRNGRTSLNLIDTLKKLEDYQKDFFIVFAHVEQRGGLWNELGGGRFGEFGKNEIFKRRILGFQQVRTRDDCATVKQWLGDWYPAEVEGSDPKSIDQIGRKNPCYLKLGSPTFEAIKFALIDYKSRLCLNSAAIYTHSHIKQIHFKGGIFNEQTIHFSPELNTFIGIRGSGKSSVLEALRYVLGIQLEKSDSDYAYKQKLVERTLGSGGQILLDAVDRHGQPYQIRRIWNGNSTVFTNDRLQPGVSICDTVLSKPLFFGQKELAAADKGSEKDLIEKLLGATCDEIRSKITEQQTKVTDVIDRFSKVSNVAELIEEQEMIKQDAEHRLEFYKKHNLEEKLQVYLGFEKDIRKMEEGIALVERFAADIRGLLAEHEDELRNFPGYLSTNNAEFFKGFDAHFCTAVQSLDVIKAELTKAEDVLYILKEECKRLVAAKNDLAEEFAAIKRTLAEELKTSHEQNISIDEFLVAKKKFAAAENALTMLLKSTNQKAALEAELTEELQELNNLWYEEFQLIREKLDEISRNNSALTLSIGFKEDKSVFLDFFQNVFKGSGVHGTTFKKIAEKYQDFVEIYLDFEDAKDLFGTNPEAFATIFHENLKALLTFQTPNKYTITYDSKDFTHHSLGQRASALILFVLGQREHDVIIIDQPEDDLDNQTLYKNVIKSIRELKPTVQFIFATHNPNVPVLGDAEQIHGCSFSNGKIKIQSGGLDDMKQQKRIVDIMEGGKEAFDRRREIYQIWKP